MGGIIRFSDGRSGSLTPVTDPDWAEQWLRRSVQPMKLWTLTVPMLPVGEDLTTPFGTVVPILGVDGEGRTVAVLFDLKVDRPLTLVLGESISTLYWSECLDEKQLETFGRYFWHNPQASLAAMWAQAFGLQDRIVSFGQQSQVHVLSWRPRNLLWEIQNFLNRHGLSILFLWLYTLQSEQGETIAIAEQVAAPLPTSAVGSEVTSVHRTGEAELFLRLLREATNS
ncbi:MAG: hypothetical protein N3B10_03940 [Armatimonadetes bacterium]|nr:hypothetical protein [Armatimonadota bacterium]MCX7967627.1 hypothetical protein [Armatimonadota bacterium]MDW8142868.1 hypothetical protein [Armatimonadota bacterium]